MFVVTVTFDADTKKVEAFRAAVLAQASNSLDREEHCRCFDVCFDPQRPERFFLYEIYDDAAAFDAHLATDHFKSFTETVGPWVRHKAVATWELMDDESQPPG